MIHNTFLIRKNDYSIIINTKYWPIDVNINDIREYMETIKEIDSDAVYDLPLMINDNKYLCSAIDNMFVVIVADKNEDDSTISDITKNVGRTIKKVLANKDIKYIIDNYDDIIDSSVTTRLKIALVGEGGVGKTTTLHLLLGDTPPIQYVPTIALNMETVENIRFGNYSLVLWDFAGQERFRKLWRFYFHGADVIFLICDSSLRNVIVSKDILKLIKRDAPKVPIFAVANKQDKPNVMSPDVVQKILGIPTYPMVAIDKGRRDEMLNLLMNAVATFVGVTVPNLPTSELLKFKEEAVEDVSRELYDNKEDLDDDIEYEESIEIGKDAVERDWTIEPTGDFDDSIDEDIGPEKISDETKQRIKHSDEIDNILDEVSETLDNMDVIEKDIVPHDEIDDSSTPVTLTNDDNYIEIVQKTDIEQAFTDNIDMFAEEDISNDETEEVLHIENTKDDNSDIQSHDKSEYRELNDSTYHKEEISIFPIYDIITTDDSVTDKPTDLEQSTEYEEHTSDIAKELVSEFIDADETVRSEIDIMSQSEIDDAVKAISSDELIDMEEDNVLQNEIDDIINDINNILGTSYEIEDDITDEIDEVLSKIVSKQDNMNEYNIQEFMQTIAIVDDIYIMSDIFSIVVKEISIITSILENYG